MTRVIHTGDTHLGYQQYHVPERREDFLAAFRQVARDAVADDVDAVVHAGDLFHDRRPTLPDILGALDVLRTLDDADVPFLAVVGNHETKRDAQWLDLFESLGLATRLGEEPVVVDDTAFYGLDFVPRASRDDLQLAFDAHDSIHAALVTHGLFEPFDLGEWDVRDLLRDANREFDAVLLGDNHDPGTRLVAEPSETWVTYCGSTERASADEREERGYNLVSFDGEGTDPTRDVDVRRRGLETREFVFVDVELGPGEGIDRVSERVGQHDLDGAVVHVRIEGDGDPITPAAVEEFVHDRGALVARVADHREFADEADVDVSFADPDEAVRDRVRELGLSQAAREIDETVRASTVADSNVDDTVEERVRELIEAGDARLFRAASNENGSEAPDEPDKDKSASGETDKDETTSGEAPASEPRDTVDGGAAPATDGQESAEATPGTDETSHSIPGDEPSNGGTGGIDSADDADADDPEDQATMEEYL